MNSLKLGPKCFLVRKVPGVDRAVVGLPFIDELLVLVHPHLYEEVGKCQAFAFLKCKFTHYLHTSFVNLHITINSLQKIMPKRAGKKY